MHEMAKDPAREHRRFSNSNSNLSINSDSAHQTQTRQILTSGLPLTFIDGRPISITTSPIRAAQLAIKRAADTVLSLVGLVLLAPLFLVAWLAVRRSASGPAFIKQEVTGRDGQSIWLYAFRTISDEQVGMDEIGNSDLHLTPVGRLLRQTNIDGLPRLINILRGDLSFIGPRPYAPDRFAEDTHLDERLRGRYAIKPGMLGWAQANGHIGGTGIELDHDLAYIENFSLWLDLRIIAMTIWREFFKSPSF